MPRPELHTDDGVYPPRHVYSATSAKRCFRRPIDTLQAALEHIALSGSTPNSSNITQASSTNNPGTAILTIPIDGNSFQFATPGRSTITSLAKSVLTGDEYSISATDSGASIGGNLFPSGTPGNTNFNNGGTGGRAFHTQEPLRRGR